ncbi:hypothetical protein HPOKI112_00080 [Helicobacter pylori oki112]|nr:hypothetical protein HPOKI112_00080 [Helicobacter pylori oki112]AHN41261.1 hypothetical protein HPOKI422_00085 [Helicobacter pylori oki422]
MLLTNLFKILFIEYNSFKQLKTRKQDEESMKNDS